MDETRLNAAADFSEWAALLRKQQREADALLEMLRPLIDGLYEEGSFPGVAHNWLQLRRDRVVIADMLELVSRLVAHESSVRALTFTQSLEA